MKKDPPNNGADEGQGHQEPKKIDKEDWLLVKTSAGCDEKILRSDICYIMAEQSYAHIIMADREIFVCTPMGELLEKLAKYGFMQVHKSYLANMLKFKNRKGKYIIITNI